MKLGKINLRWVILGFFLVFLSWNIVVALSGLGINLFRVSWDFKTMGEFGDSFGFLNSISSICAALFTYMVLVYTIGENDNLKKEVGRKEVEEIKRRHEERYFSLLDLRLRILEKLKLNHHLVEGRKDDGSIDISVGASKYLGVDAINYVSGDIRVSYYVGFNFHGSGEDDKKEKYTLEDCHKVLFWFRDDLGHYFRFTYHIIKYIDSNISDRVEAYNYLRMLRAQWTESEQVLIAFNSAFGFGVDKFKPLINKYALLHGIPISVRMYFNLDDVFEASAFEFNPNSN